MAQMAGRGCIGVVGGLGPAATADMLEKLILATSAGRDEDHLRIVVDCDPDIPSPTKYLAGLGPSPVRPLVRSARMLAGQGADVLVMACNTAHAFYPVVAEAVPVPVVHLMRATAGWLRAEHPEISRVGVLATTSCVRAGLYQEALRAAGLHVAVPTRAEQRQVMRAIMEPDGVKAGELTRPAHWLAGSAARLAARGCQAIIAGCTEIPLVLDQAALDRAGLDVRYVDPTEIAAAETVRLAQSAPHLSRSDNWRDGASAGWGEHRAV